MARKDDYTHCSVQRTGSRDRLERNLSIDVVVWPACPCGPKESSRCPCPKTLYLKIERVTGVSIFFYPRASGQTGRVS
eukprot:scaffold44259_cov84-Phaeocystis_antarctica.AAC.2